MAELLSRVSSAELTEWRAFWALEPFGAEAENWRAGMQASVLANVNRARGQRAFTAEDFMPGRRPERKRPQGPGAMLAAFRALTAGAGGPRGR